MKNNLTMFFILCCLAFVGSYQSASAQCIPTGASTVFGTADANTGSTFSFTGVPTGNVITLVATGPNDVFTFDLCANAADGWADGTADSNLSVLDANSGTANALANLDDGCTNGAGPEFWGPSFGAWSPTTAGTYYLYLTEWNYYDPAYDNPCIADGVNSYNINITVSAPGICEADDWTNSNPLDVCPGSTEVINIGATAQSDGGYVIGFSDGAGGTGGLAGGFTLTNVTPPYNLNSNLNGVLPNNNIPDLGGTWELTLYALDAAGEPCDSTSVLSVNFLAVGDPNCQCEAGDWATMGPLNICPGETDSLEVDGNQVAGGGFAFGFDDAAGGTGGLAGGFTITGFNSLADFPYVIDNDLSGVLSSNNLPLLQGQWEVTLFALDGAGGNCDSTAAITVNFLDVNDPNCNAGPCEAGDWTTMSPLTVCSGVTDSLEVDGTQVSDGGFELGFSDANGGTGGLAGGFTLTGFPDATAFPYLFDDDLGGVLSANNLPVLGGSWDITLYALDGVGNPCDSSSVMTVNFVPAPNATLTASYDCTANSITVDVTASDFTGGMVEVAGQSQMFTGVGMYTFSGLTPDQTYTAILTDDNCGSQFGQQVLPQCSTPCAGATEGLTDGGLEGAPGSAWTEILTNPSNTDTIDIPIVDASNPLVGAQSAWFGGFGADGSISYLTQSITIPANTASATLTFWALEGGECSAGDVLTVSVGGTTEFTQDGTNANCGSGEWHMYMVDLSAYADGMAYDLVIQYDQLSTTGNSNLFLDNASLEICPCPNLSLSTASTAETCGDASGTATVTAMGGTGYTYMWSNGDMTATATGLASGTHTVTVTDTGSGCTATATAMVMNQLSTTALTVTVSSTPENCGSNDGSAMVDNVTGGSGNYSYMWVTGDMTASVSGLAAGTYPVTVTDMMTGCSGTATASVGSAGGPNVVVDNIMDASCNGGMDGAIMISVSGGAMPYTFSWSNGETTEDISGLAAGDYTGTVTDDNGCSFIANATIGEPMEIMVNVDALNNASCNGGANGSILISVTGGTAPYMFSWSNGDTTEDIAGLAAGDYTGTITDANGCELVAGPVTITEPTMIDVTVDALTDASCNGGADGAIAISVSGGTAPYTFSWSNGALTEDLTGLAAGDYTGTITDFNGCELVAGPVTVGEPTAIDVVVDNVLGSFGTDGVIEITVSGGTPPYTYAWSNGDTTEDLGGLAAGDYTGTITDANGCELVAGPVTISDLTSVEDIDEISSFSLTPNPTMGDVRIEINMDANYDVDLQVFDLTGRALISSMKPNTNQAVFELDMSSFADGVYFARFTVDGKVFTERIIKSN